MDTHNQNIPAGGEGGRRKATNGERLEHWRGRKRLAHRQKPGNTTKRRGGNKENYQVEEENVSVVGDMGRETNCGKKDEEDSCWGTDGGGGGLAVEKTMRKTGVGEQMVEGGALAVEKKMRKTDGGEGGEHWQGR